LGPDPAGEGDIVATLIRRGPETGLEHAVLAVHGYTDYFFNIALADHFVNRGFTFYALDLQKCGRSRRDGQTPHFITDLAQYDTDLERRNAKAHAGIGGLILNSPFLDLHGPAILRMGMTSAMIAGLSRVRSKGVVRPSSKGGYGTSLHRDYGGEFDYDLQWKPLGGFPITVGWLNAVRRGQARLHRGLDVGVHNLILRSDHSVRETADPSSMQRGDAVLDVTQIARWAGCIGNRSAIVPVADAKHDVFLSLQEPREVAYRELDLWLDGYLRTTNTDASASSGKG
jgi:alpha-beta hydrolase superfamily lysophospholipase